MAASACPLELCAELPRQAGVLVDFVVERDLITIKKDTGEIARLSVNEEHGSSPEGPPPRPVQPQVHLMAASSNFILTNHHAETFVRLWDLGSGTLVCQTSPDLEVPDSKGKRKVKQLAVSSLGFTAPRDFYVVFNDGASSWLSRWRVNETSAIELLVTSAQITRLLGMLVLPECAFYSTHDTLSNATVVWKLPLHDAQSQVLSVTYRVAVLAASSKFPGVLYGGSDRGHLFQWDIKAAPVNQTMATLQCRQRAVTSICECRGILVTTVNHSDAVYLLVPSRSPLSLTHITTIQPKGLGPIEAVKVNNALHLLAFCGTSLLSLWESRAGEMLDDSQTQHALTLEICVENGDDAGMHDERVGIQEALLSYEGRKQATLSVVQTDFASQTEKYFQNFKFMTFAPVAYAYLREMLDMDLADFRRAICEKPWDSMDSAGKSGSKLWLSHNKEFVIKTLHLNEVKFLPELLQSYLLHQLQTKRHGKRTLMPTYLGHFQKRKNSSIETSPFIVMRNVFPPSVQIHERYDLKGTEGRTPPKSSATLIERDLEEKHPSGFLLSPQLYSELQEAISADCKLLTSLRVMDYSLLVGVHHGPINEGLLKSGGLLARTQCGEEDVNVVLFVGIIDVLQQYDAKKQAEHNVKKLVKEARAISVKDPVAYSKQFQQYLLGQVFRPSSADFRHEASASTTVKAPRPRALLPTESAAASNDRDYVVPGVGICTSGPAEGQGLRSRQGSGDYCALDPDHEVYQPGNRTSLHQDEDYEDVD